MSPAAESVPRHTARGPLHRGGGVNGRRAVAPVVAAMLLLAALVMFLSVYNAVVVPSFKEQAEVEHLYAVEESFLAFGSDMTTAAALNRTCTSQNASPSAGAIRSSTVRSVAPGLW